MSKRFLLFLAFLIETEKVKMEAQAFNITESLDFFTRLSEIRKMSDKSENAMNQKDFSAPGTKWCGPGNTATDYDDLGSEVETDKCCRAHDHCDSIASGQTKYGLTNNDYFTRLHCACDKEFRQCLKNVNKSFATGMGNFYFSIRDSCYKNSHPIVDCDTIHYGFFTRRCCKYKVDKLQEKKYQWFDLPFYNDEHEFEVLAN